MNNSIIRTYNKVLSGRLKRFPRNFLNKDVCIKILRHVILDKYGMTREDICKHVNIAFIRKNAMQSFYHHFGKSNISMIKEAFREFNIMSWELSRTENGFWKNEANQRLFLFWLIQKEGLDVTNPMDFKKITNSIILKYTSHCIIDEHGSMFNLIRTITGDLYKEWEITNIKTWTRELAIEATKWLVEQKLSLKANDELLNKVHCRDFKKYGLHCLLLNFGNDTSKVLRLAYPELN